MSAKARLLIWSIRTYYRFRSPLLRRLVSLILPYTLRTRWLQAHDDVKAVLQLKQHAKDVKSTRAGAMDRADVMEDFADEPGHERKIVNYRVAVEAPSPTLVTRVDSPVPFYQLAAAPYWGVGLTNPARARNYHTLPQLVFRFPEAEIHGDCFGVFVSDDFYSMMLSQPTPFVFNCYRQNEIAIKGRRASIRLTPKTKRHKLEKAIYFTSDDGHAVNYFHFQVDALPSLINSARGIPVEHRHEFTILVPNSIPSSIRALLDLFVRHFSLKTVDLSESSHFHVNDLVFSPYSSQLPDVQALDHLTPFHVVPEQIRSIRSILVEEIAPPSLAGGAPDIPIVYLSRRDLGRRGQRHIVNSRAIGDLVESKGGCVLLPEQLSIDEQMNAMSRASCVICDAGAGVANALFCRPDTPFIVMSHSSSRPNIFMSYLEALGMRQGYVFGPPIAEPGVDIAHANCAISLDDLRRALCSFGGADRTHTGSADGWL